MAQPGLVSGRSGMRVRLAATLVWLVVCTPACLACAPAAAAPVPVAAAAAEQKTEPADYAALSPPKALAVSPGHEKTAYGIAHDRADDLAASMGAMSACEAVRPPDASACELRYLNSERITTGQEIRARVPAGPHPLYLWRFEGNASRVFLAGSIHVLKPSLYPLPEQYALAFERSDHLAVEVNAQAYDPQEIQRKTRQFARLPRGQTLQAVLPEHLHARLLDHLAAYGLEKAAIDGVNPAFLMNQLVVARLLALGYWQEFGMEQHFLARLASRDVFELETLDEQLRLLFEQPLPVQIQLLADTLEQEYAIEALLADMLVAWLSGDDASLETLFEAQVGESALVRQFNEQLLDKRNVTMAAKVNDMLDHGSGTYFVVIGAAHYLGDAGIISLLEQRGVRGRRITTDTPPDLLLPSTPTTGKQS